MVEVSRLYCLVLLKYWHYSLKVAFRRSFIQSVILDNHFDTLEMYEMVNISGLYVCVEVVDKV